MHDNLNIDDISKGIMATFVRVLGFVLLLAGLWIAFDVLFEAWDLYQQPEKIERFARAIEQGSNIDKSLMSIRKSVIAPEPEVPETDSVTGSESPAGISQFEGTRDPSERQSGEVRVSYFLAWVIVLLLLMLIARIALGVIKTGGELVLYDMQIKQFAKMLVRESGKLRD